MEGCTSVVSQHRERAAGCSVTTSSPLLLHFTPLQGFMPWFDFFALTFFSPQMTVVTCTLTFLLFPTDSFLHKENVKCNTTDLYVQSENRNNEKQSILKRSLCI